MPSAFEIRNKILTQELTAYEYVSMILDRISEADGQIHAYLSVQAQAATSQAKEIDKKVKRGKEVGMLAGLPVAIKDNICTKDIPTTCSSRMLEGFVPPYEATVVSKIRGEDGVVIGKTNMDEFAMGTSTETSFFGVTHNPWDLSRVAGGSSGGSTAAVSAGEAALSLGSDTGGSVRCPASFCSVVGLKPTYGLVSRYGLIAYANSLDQIGPIGRTVRDCALLLDVVAGYDPEDGTSIQPEGNYLYSLGEGSEGMRVGLLNEIFGSGTDPRIERHVRRETQRFNEIGADCEEVSIPILTYSLPAYYIIALSEASSNLARYDGIRYGIRAEDKGLNWKDSASKTRGIGFGIEVKRRIILGAYALSAGYYDQYYLKALKIRTLIREGFQEAFKKFDVLVGPTMPVLPFKIGERVEDPLTMYMCDIDTVPVNLAGICAISVPCGFIDGLPVGMQIVGNAYNEKKILRIANAYEEKAGYTRKHPQL
ncbi:Asp-tRNA(Asn)/Glu-tRNA(Gln) amidotransferase subunit GatA [Candidatus Bathyarchaeota archaeon]|nr:Asp-tRNA(Asn)/Glu-tRNA(Gln) amidotransferase subunit GatA [Candidatus Bathyarchaeota archaeon]